MSLILRRYTRTTGYAPSWFYVLAAAGFIALTIWAVTQRDWLVAAIATTMVIGSIGVGLITRRLRASLEQSQQQHDLTTDNRRSMTDDRPIEERS